MPKTMDKYKMYKNKLTNVIHYAERQYYQQKFELAKGNMNKTWQILITVINPNAQNKLTIDKIVINDLLMTDKPEISNKFNEYFVNVSSTLANNILPVPGDVTSYINLRIDIQTVCSLIQLMPMTCVIL